MGLSQEIKDCHGIVKGFDSVKGIGIIIGPQQQDIFFHFSSIETREGEFRIIEEGTPVIFSASLTQRGWVARRIVRCTTDASKNFIDGRTTEYNSGMLAVGSLTALANTDLPEPPSPEAIKSLGITLPAAGERVISAPEMVRQFIDAPNHALFLYTTEDRVIDAYIKSNWVALDGLSGKHCDIHPSLEQLRGREDVYSVMEDLREIPGLQNIAATDLPFLHIWSARGMAKVPLGAVADNELQLRDLLRLVFEEIRMINAPIDEKSSKRVTAKAEKFFSQQRGKPQVVHWQSHAVWLLPLCAIGGIVLVIGARLSFWQAAVTFSVLVTLFGLYGAYVLRSQDRVSESGLVRLVAMAYKFGATSFVEVVRGKSSRKS